MDFFNNNRRLIISLVTIICIASAIFTVDRVKPTFIENTFGFIITPVQSFNTRTVDWFNNKKEYFKGITGLAKENEELKTELEKVTAELNMLRLIEDENSELGELLQIQKKYSNYNLVGANIIAKDPSNWYDTFLIDKGTKDGMQKNMVVLTADGLVGRIKECGYNYSKVVSIIDDSDSVSAMSLRTDDIGYVHSDLTSNGLCKMDYVDSSAEIIEGDEIITSHLSDIFPEGITIGYVKEIHTDTNALTKYAVITPAVDFKHLDTVLVINQVFENELIESPTETTTQQ